MLDTPDKSSKVTAQTAASDADTSRARLLGILERRRSMKPFQLVEPKPSVDEIQQILAVAARVPDHGGLEPWRIILVQDPAREELIARLSAASLKANAQQEPAAAELAVKKIKTLFGAPLVAIVVSRADSSARIPEWEQVLSAGAVCMNLITAVTALGYGATWLTGWTAYNPAALEILGIGPHEKIAGIIPIGTASETVPDRPRPALQKLVTTWSAR
jgi:nitroreductase